MDELKTEEIKEEAKVEEIKKEDACDCGDQSCDSEACGCKCKCCAHKKKIIIGIILVVLIAATGAFYYYKKTQKVDIGMEAAKAKIENLIADSKGVATVGDVSLEGDFYKVIIKAGGSEQPVYVTKDGTKLIQGVITFEEIEKEKAAANASQEKAAPQEITKSDKPTVDLFVMAFCPYGNKSEDTMKSVYDLLKNKVDFNVHYIVTSNGDEIQSLHGSKEVEQNEREVCVLKNYGKDKWFGFVMYVNKNCGSDGVCWEAGAKSWGIDVSKINNCVKNEGVALMKEDEKAARLAGATGSPTLKINGASTEVVYQYGNSEAYKQAICGAFNKVPAECSKKLSAQVATAQGGSCGK